MTPAKGPVSVPPVALTSRYSDEGQSGAGGIHGDGESGRDQGAAGHGDKIRGRSVDIESQGARPTDRSPEMVVVVTKESNPSTFNVPPVTVTRPVPGVGALVTASSVPSMSSVPPLTMRSSTVVVPPRVHEPASVF